MYVAYIYDPFWNPITQVFGLNKVNAVLKLNSISEASFEIYPNNLEAKFSTFRMFNKIKLSYINQSKEIKIIEWEISLVTAQDTIQIQIKDFNNLFQDKKILVDTVLNWPLNELLESELDKINLRQDTWFVLDCDITDTIELDTIKKWSSFYDLLQKVAQAWYEYTFEDKKIVVKNSIGIDRTSWPNYYELSFDETDLKNRTIRNSKQLYNWANLKNVVYDQNWTMVKDDDSIDDWSRREARMTTSVWQTIDTYLQDRKDLVKEIEVTPIRLNFEDVGIWDMIHCYINRKSDIQYFSWDVKVIEKRITWSDLKKTELKVSKWSVKTLDLFETIKDIQDRQRLMEL